MNNSDFYSNKVLYKRLLVRAILAALFIFCIIVVVPRLVHMLLPFIIAIIVAAVVNPAVNKINLKLKMSRRIIAFILDLMVFVAIFSIIGALAYSIVIEAADFATSVQKNWSTIVAKFGSLEGSFAWLYSFLPPQINDLLADFEDTILSFFQNASKNLLSYAISATTTMTTKTGSFFVNLFMSILAAYFTIADYDRISAFAKKHMGKRIEKYVSILKRSTITALGGYLKSQLLLGLSAFLFMFVALTIYGQQYAFLIALFLGVIDLLPIVGTIAALVPWGIIEFASGNMNKGLFLIIIGIAFFLLRKIIEPRIVGSQTGLHPLAALMSTYIGLQVSGVWGAIIGPIVLMLIISIAKSGIFDNTVSDLKAVVNNVANILTISKS